MVRLPLLLLSAVAFGSASPLLNLIYNIETLYKIEIHNANPARTYNMSFHDIAALSSEEYKKRLGLRVPAVRPKSSKTFKLEENFVVPESFDWREHGVVSQIKNQKSCGSCWAFSAVGALEGQHARRNGTLVEFSEQNLVDCSSEFGNAGCDGGLPDFAFKYVMKNGGIDTEEAYPYKAEDEKCHFSKESVGETDEGFADLPMGDEEVLKQAVAAIGPISVGIDAGQPSFKLYGGGVYFEPDCETEQLNHAVLIVGYGTDATDGDYWLVKNSWGTDWGEEGYIRMARNRDNNCGIATVASYPIVM